MAGVACLTQLDWSRATSIADAVRDAGGRALIVGGWVRDRLLGRHESKNIDLEVFGVPADRLRALLESFGRVEAVGESFQVYKLGDIDVSLPRRESKAGRGHRGFVVTGDPDDVDRGGGAAARLHHQRDLVGSADRRILRSVRRPRAISSGGCCAWSIRATFADDSLRVLRAVQFAARFDFDARRRDARALPRRSRSTICRPSASGARSRSCCSRRGRRSASRSRWISASSRSCFPSCRRSPAARRSRSGIPKATSGCTRCR